MPAPVTQYLRPHGSAVELEARWMKALDLNCQGWRVMDLEEALNFR